MSTASHRFQAAKLPGRLSWGYGHWWDITMEFFPLEAGFALGMIFFVNTYLRDHLIIFPDPANREPLPNPSPNSLPSVKPAQGDAPGEA